MNSSGLTPSLISRSGLSSERVTAGYISAQLLYLSRRSLNSSSRFFKSVVFRLLHGRRVDVSAEFENGCTRKMRVRLFETGDWNVLKEFTLGGAYPLENLGYTPEVVVDIGAHIGFFSIKAASYFPAADLVSIEPDFENQEMLRHNISVNKLTPTMIDSAVSNWSGYTAMTGMSSDGKRIDTSEQGSTRVIRLAEVVDLGKYRSALIKCDVEGQELAILGDLSTSELPDKTTVFFEVHNGIEEFKEIQECLEPAGFVVSEINCRGKLMDCVATRAASRQ